MFSVAEYNRLRENRFDTINADFVDCNSLTVSLLNTRSLKRHAADISRARQLIENDILCLTESQITYDTDVAEIKKQLITFEIYFNSCGVRHKNLAFCLGQNIVLSKHETFLAYLLLILQKPVFHTMQYGLCCCIVLQVHLSQHSIIHWKIYSVTIMQFI